jgi:hypothetical protein
MQLFVQGIGKTLTIQISPQDFVGDLALRIQDKTGMVFFFVLMKTNFIYKVVQEFLITFNVSAFTEKFSILPQV